MRYGTYRGPLTASPGERLTGTIELTNEGWDAWSTETSRIFTSYHWLDEQGRIAVLDGERTPLPRSIAAGETHEVALTIRTPATPGRYQLAIDLVHEGVTWFSEAGHPWFALAFEVRSRP